MKTDKYTVLCVAGLAAALAGCNAPAPPDRQSSVLISAGTGEDFDRLWEVTTTVLRGHELTPVLEDRAAGVITTTPTTSQQWFECWRHDVADGYSLVESSLHTMRRQVTVNIERSGDPTMYLLTIAVEKSRMSLPERQVTSAAGAIQSFGSRLPTASGELAKASAVRHWIPMGRDAAMEDLLLRQIIRRYGPATVEYVHLTESSSEESPPALEEGESGGAGPPDEE
jgi:hypothetical protein